MVWFGILGPLEVKVNGRPITLHGPRQERALAALLLSADQVVPIDRLVDVVWEEPPASARRQVQDLVTRLRRTLVAAGAAPDLITTRRAGYLLRPDDGGLDTGTFTGLVTSARETVPVDAAAAVAGFRGALLLWRGRPLAGIDGRAFETAAETWQERRLAVVEECLALELSLGRNREVVAEAMALVEQHPFRESLVGLLMRALHDAGRLADALEAYRALRGRLADELGLDPCADLNRLHDTLLSSEPEAREPPEPHPRDVSAPVTVRASAAPASQARQPAALLPLDVYGFVGRTAELERLDALLDTAEYQPTAVVVSALSGTVGVGKSTLAVHWAHRVRHRFPDGQLYVNLRGVAQGRAATPSEAVRGFLDALGVTAEQMPRTLEAKVGLYRSLLTDRRILVVLDNARDAEQVRPLLPGSPSCLVVVTSRNQLPGLVAAEGAHPLCLDLLTDAEARELLARRLGAARVAAEPEAVEEIIARCARLPLALAVVAARAAIHSGFPLAALANELREARGGLDAFDEGDPDTQVRAVFSCSYHALGPGAARLFRLLGLHPGPDIALAAAASLAGMPVARVRPLLAELTRAHLLTQHAPGRYTFHDLLRAYATELAHGLDPEPEHRTALHRLFDHYLRTAHTAALLLSPHRAPLSPPPPLPEVVPEEISDLGQALSWFIAERTVLLTVIPQAAGAGFDTHTWQIAWALTDFLDRRGCWLNQAAIHESALAAARRACDLAGQAHVHRDLGWAYTRLDRHDEADAHFRSALHLYGRLGDHSGKADTHGTLSTAFSQRGRHQDSLHHAQQALGLYEAVGHRAGRARALNAVGRHHALLGDHHSALTYSAQALQVLNELGDRQGQADVWDCLGYAHHHLGQHRQAITCYRRALGLFREAGHRYHEAGTLTRLSESHAAAGDPDAAHEAWQEALSILDTFSHPGADQVRTRLEYVQPSRSLR
ncbi:BTAD domain-containing putative transcriptional regulator [Streptosporangium sp. NPDC051023]|uniref:AfsR/SARP family transcriptional regulator n=1 Tax=Streptosporangium sp. NPDC051023 TaxID=3155410 RepID=UPI00344FC832